MAYEESKGHLYARTIMIGIEKNGEYAMYETGLITYFGMPKSRAFPSFLWICPISGFPSISMNPLPGILLIQGMVNARFFHVKV